LSSTDYYYSFTTLKTIGDIQYKDTAKYIPYVFYEHGKPQENAGYKVAKDFFGGNGHVHFRGDSDEILDLYLGSSEYMSLKHLKINRYNLDIVGYIGDCEFINKEIFIEARSNFEQLREKTLKEMQQDFAL